MITIDDIKAKIPRTYLISSIASFVFGFMAYGYIYLNPIFIHDASTTAWGVNIKGDIFCGAERMTPLTGIWYLLQGGVQVPLFAGILSLFLCGVATYFVCDYLEIKNDLFVVLVAGIMTVCPALISANIYGAGGLPFVMALFFASAGPWFCKRNTLWSYAVAIMCLVVSTATYPSYLQWAACIFIIKQIKILIEQNEINVLQLIKRDFFYGFMLVASVGIDIFVSFFIIDHAGFTAQGRVDSAFGLGSASQTRTDRVTKALDSLKNMILELLPPFVTKHFNKAGGYYSVFEYNPALWVLFFVTWGFFLFLIIRHVQKLSSKNTRLMLLTIHAIVLFFAMDILTYVTWAHTLMQYAHITPWILLLSVADSIVNNEDLPKKISKMAQYALMVMCAFTIIYESLIANVGYLKDEAIFRTGVLAANRIAGRLESIEGYKDNEVYFIGTLDNYGAPNNESAFYLANGLTGVSVNRAYTYEYVFQTYLSQYIGKEIKYAETPAWKKMDAEDYFEYLNDHEFDGCEEEFITKFNETEDLPGANNYFWFHDILVFRLETQ